MNKNQLAAAIADRTDGTTQAQAKAFLDAFTAEVQEVLSDGEKVVIPGFGTFERKHSAARTAKNPVTGDPIDVAARYRASFKAGTGFKEAVNAGSQA